MIDETDVVTYHSNNAAREDLAWTAYVVLPNGEYWGVRFSSSTEHAVIAKAISFYNAEKEKYKKLEPYVEPTKPLNDPWSSHANTGKIWMRHKESRELKRVVLTEISMYEKNGFERSGPRSK